MLTHLGFRATVFCLTGAGYFAYWLIADPSTEAQASQFQWPHVLSFSGILVLLAAAVALYGGLVGGRLVVRFSSFAAAALSINGIANIFEDGLGMEWVFFVFVFGTAMALLGLIAVSIVMAVTGRASRRLLGFVPAFTVVAIVTFVSVGGPLMLVTWLGAAAVALAVQPQAVSEPSFQPQR